MHWRPGNKRIILVKSITNTENKAKKQLNCWSQTSDQVRACHPKKPSPWPWWSSPCACSWLADETPQLSWSVRKRKSVSVSPEFTRTEKTWNVIKQMLDFCWCSGFKHFLAKTVFVSPSLDFNTVMEVHILLRFGSFSLHPQHCRQRVVLNTLCFTFTCCIVGRLMDPRWGGWRGSATFSRSSNQKFAELLQ